MLDIFSDSAPHAQASRWCVRWCPPSRRTAAAGEEAARRPRPGEELEGWAEGWESWGATAAEIPVAATKGGARATWSRWWWTCWRRGRGCWRAWGRPRTVWGRLTYACESWAMRRSRSRGSCPSPCRRYEGWVWEGVGAAVPPERVYFTQWSKCWFRESSCISSGQMQVMNELREGSFKIYTLIRPEMILSDVIYCFAGAQTRDGSDALLKGTFFFKGPFIYWISLRPCLLEFFSEKCAQTRNQTSLFLWCHKRIHLHSPSYKKHRDMKAGVRTWSVVHTCHRHRLHFKLLTFSKKETFWDMPESMN